MKWAPGTAPSTAWCAPVRCGCGASRNTVHHHIIFRNLAILIKAFWWYAFQVYFRGHVRRGDENLQHSDIWLLYQCKHSINHHDLAQLQPPFQHCFSSFNQYLHEHIRSLQKKIFAAQISPNFTLLSTVFLGFWILEEYSQLDAIHFHFFCFLRKEKAFQNLLDWIPVPQLPKKRAESNVYLKLG